MLNRKNIDNLHATSHIQDRYSQFKNNKYLIRETNDETNYKANNSIKEN